MLDFFSTTKVSNSLGPDQGRHFVWPDLGPNCLQRLISRQQKSLLMGKEINTKQLVDTTFWLKPWLKFYLALTFSIWLKCWLQQTLSQGKPCMIPSFIRSNIGITHVFSCINIYWVPRTLFEHEVDRSSAQTFPEGPS